MEFDRNRYFMFGVLIFLLGIQFRAIESFTLNEPSTRALHRFVQNTEIADPNFPSEVALSISNPRKTFTPPRWIGWSLLTVGGVISLHAFVLPKPHN